VVVDDGSTDGAAQVPSSCANRIFPRQDSRPKEAIANIKL
jgi:hypothetical protein